MTNDTQKNFTGTSSTANKLEGNWKQLKGLIKEKWGKLTDDDLTKVEGKFDQLAGRLQERYGFEQERAKEEVDAFRQQVKSKL